MTRIRVVGTCPVAGINPGCEGDVDMKEQQLSRLIRGGHIQKVAPPPADIEEHDTWAS